MGAQVIFGSALLVLCALTHVAAVAISVPIFPRLRKAFDKSNERLRISALLCFGLLVIVAAHTVQIWTWAVVFYLVGAFDGFATSFYFAAVTYTTLGYGDLVLGEPLRIFATFASITGLLTFGISTAFLIAILVRVMPEQFDR